MDRSATIVLASRNRREELLRALASCYEQEWPDLEVLVYDDCSTDGSAEAVEELHPSAKVFRQEKRVGQIVLRDRALREARGDVIFSLDDDAYFTSPGTVRAVMQEFDRYPDAGALAIPYVERRGNRIAPPMASLPPGSVLRTFVGCAAAVRRVESLEVGGFRGALVRQGEERDLSMRLYGAGMTVRLADAPHIVHLPSDLRDPSRIQRFGIRNTFVFSLLYAPLLNVVPRLAIDAVQVTRYRCTLDDLPLRLKVVSSGLLSALRFVRDRSPVDRSVYRRWKRLPGHGPVRHI